MSVLTSIHSAPLLCRPVARVWTVVLLLGTCLLYCARVAMPICAVSMSEQFNWSKRESGMVLGSFFWGYCFTQVFGGYVSDRWAALWPQTMVMLWDNSGVRILNSVVQGCLPCYQFCDVSLGLTSVFSLSNLSTGIFKNTTVTDANSPVLFAQSGQIMRLIKLDVLFVSSCC